MNVRQGKEWFDQVREKFFTEPAERQTRQRYSELRRRKVSVEMRANIFHEPRPRIPLLCQFIELTRAYFDNREFACDEKSVQGDEGRDRQQFPDDDTRRIPLSDGRVCERK